MATKSCPLSFEEMSPFSIKKKSLATYAMVGYRRINLTAGHQSRKAHARASPPMLEAPTADCWRWMAIFSPPMFRKVKAKRRDQSTEKLEKGWQDC